jgi:hypothetical protein
MKFSCITADLIAALDAVSIVTPRALTASGGTGYLFVLRKNDDGHVCYVYSRDNFCVARASFPVTDAEGEGPFVYPSQFVDAFRYLGDTCTLEATSDGDKHTVKYESNNGASSEKATLDPTLLSTCDRDLETTKDESEFSAGALREALSLARPFAAKPNDTRTEEQFKAILLFDSSKPDWAKGEGVFFASNGIQAFYLYSDLFKGRSFEVHGQHLGPLTGLLAKSEGAVTVKRGDSFTFLVNSKGHVFGWPRHAKSHGKFSYYALKTDQYVFSVAKADLLAALKYTRVELDSKKDKIKLLLDIDTKRLQFGVSEGSSKALSFPVTFAKVEKMGERSLALNVNIDHLISLIEGVRIPEVELRIALIKPEGATKEVAMFRTIEEYRVTADGKITTEGENSWPMKVTRFVPSKD